MSYASYTIAKIQMEEADLYSKVKALYLDSRKSLSECVRDAAITFLQSAGAATNISKKKRVIKPTENGDPKYIQRNFAYKINFIRKKNNENGKRFFTLYYKTRLEAERHQPIGYWGLTRAGWVGNLVKLGKTANLKNPNLTSMLSKITFTSNAGNEIEMRNRVLGVSSYALYTKKEGLYNANIRMNHFLKRLGIKWESQFNKGK
jgi:hypothetical protein